MHELRYFQEIHALSDDIDLLWLLKCRYIMNGLFQYPEGLKIYYDGREEWLFDYLPTKKQASQVVAESCFSDFDAAKSRKGMVKNVV